MFIDSISENLIPIASKLKIDVDVAAGYSAYSALSGLVKGLPALAASLAVLAIIIAVIRFKFSPSDEAAQATFKRITKIIIILMFFGSFVSIVGFLASGTGDIMMARALSYLKRDF